MSATLQDRVRSFTINLRLLAVNPGYIDVRENAGARSFYEYWAALNRDCIPVCSGDDGPVFSLVAERLDALLADFPKGKTTTGVLEVFPQSLPFSAYLFGCYVGALEQIAVETPTPA